VGVVPVVAMIIIITLCTGMARGTRAVSAFGGVADQAAEPRRGGVGVLGTEPVVEGVRVVKISLVVLLVTSVAQAVVVVVTGSVALLADTIHNFSTH